jgi:hypothetical protein
MFGDFGLPMLTGFFRFTIETWRQMISKKPPNPNSLWLTIPAVASELGISYPTLREKLRIYSEHDADFELPDGTVIRFYRRSAKGWWKAKRADLAPSMRESKPRKSRGAASVSDQMLKDTLGEAK